MFVVSEPHPAIYRSVSTEQYFELIGSVRLVIQRGVKKILTAFCWSKKFD